MISRRSPLNPVRPCRLTSTDLFEQAQSNIMVRGTGGDAGRARMAKAMRIGQITSLGLIVNFLSLAGMAAAPSLFVGVGANALYEGQLQHRHPQRDHCPAAPDA